MKRFTLWTADDYCLGQAEAETLADALRELGLTALDVVFQGLTVDVERVLYLS